MSSTDGSHKVGIVTASAGTGKTYDLTSRIEAESNNTVREWRRWRSCANVLSDGL